MDGNEISQINSNVHQSTTDVYIPCITTYCSFLGNKDEFSDSAEVFFEYAAFHKSKGTELKQRKNPVRVFRTSPIQEILHEIAVKEYEKSESSSLPNSIQLVFSATEPYIFESVMGPELSIFEKSIILKDECGDSVNIIIVSNHQNIESIKVQAEEESEKSLDEGITIINTNEWFMQNVHDPDVSRIFFSILQKKKKLIIGDRKFVME